MNTKDYILSVLLTKVKKHPAPEDHPTLSKEIAIEVNLPLDKVMDLCQELSTEGLLAISTLHDPPLLYLTLPGVARARRIIATAA